MSPTRKTGQHADVAAAEDGQAVAEQTEPMPQTPSEPAYDAADVATAATPIVSAPQRQPVAEPLQAPAPEPGPASEQETPEPARQEEAGEDVSEGAEDRAVAEDAAADLPVPAPGTVSPPEPERPLTATQLANDPLLGTHDEILVDVGLKLRWAAIGWAVLGVVASWLIAAQVAIAVKQAAAFGWAAAATILIAAGTVWYVADAHTRFASAAAYRAAKTPQAIARLDRGGVVGLTSTIATWLLIALVALTVASGSISAVLTVSSGAGGWSWFFGAVPAVLLYVAAFALLHHRVLERARDAVA